MTLSENKPPEKWYFKTIAVITAFLTIGPLALPLVLLHPRYPRWVKLIVSVATVVLTYYLIRLTDETIKNFSTQYSELAKVMEQLR